LVFKRRDKQSFLRRVAGFFWPRTGWMRAALYVKHRLWRLPDPPHRIARGIFAGVFVTFSPFFGLHFVLSAMLAWLMRGNIIAALLATFVGNPPTFVVIAAVSLQTGHFILGRPPPGEVDEGMFRLFGYAIRDTFWNLWAILTGQTPEWGSLPAFYQEVFLPYMVGGIIPGLIAGIAAYYITLPIIQAYQNRRKGRIKAKLAALKAKAAAKKAGVLKKPDKAPK